MTRAERVRKQWTATIMAAAVLALPAACRSSKASADTLAASALSKASTSSPQGSPRAGTPRADSSHIILFIGTSLTAGLGLNPDSAYPQLIQQKIQAAHLPFEVVNAGLSGETTAGLLSRLDWLMRGRFDAVVVETGANDGLRGTPAATVRENLRTILTRIRAAHPNAELFLVQMEAPPNLGKQYTSAFHAMYPEVAKETGATLVPFLLNGVAGDPKLNQADGIHPNPRGERIVADNVWRSLEPVLENRKGTATR
jgi:acyl-CoA thioesterase-1